MIKIESWFPDNIRKKYLDFILQKLNKTADYEIEFLKNKRIKLKTLLTGTRHEVFNVDGIKEYMKLCLFTKEYSSMYSQAQFLKYLNRFYPDIILSRPLKNDLVFKLNKHTISFPYNSLQKRITGDMTSFYSFYLSKTETKPIDKKKLHTFKDFKKTIKKAEMTFLNRTSLINYDLLSNDMRNLLLSSLHIKCCPYCNRQYITTWYTKKNEVHSTADLDHFYQKSTFPLFSLSLFNFIPSCQICNSRMKGNNHTETLYPFEECMDVFRFMCLPKKKDPNSLVDFWLANIRNDSSELLNQHKLSLIDESSDDYSRTACGQEHIERIRNSIKVFCLNEVYQTHIETAINEILKIRVYFSGDYAKYSKNTLHDIGLLNTDNKLDEKNVFSEEEMRNIVLGFVCDGQNIIDQPLGKLLNDIWENEMLIKKSFIY